MAKGVKHYLKSGVEYTGPMHKMPNGSMHTGRTHTPNSKLVVHFKELSPTAKRRAKG